MNHLRQAEFKDSNTSVVSALAIAVYLIATLINWLWLTIAESSSWQPPQGNASWAYVTDEAGARIGFGRANARYWGKALFALLVGIGFFMAAFTKRKQALHDMISSTLVTRG